MVFLLPVADKSVCVASLLKAFNDYPLLWCESSNILKCLNDAKEEGRHQILIILYPGCLASFDFSIPLTSQFLHLRAAYTLFLPPLHAFTAPFRSRRSHLPNSLLAFQQQLLPQEAFPSLPFLDNLGSYYDIFPLTLSLQLQWFL